MARPFRMKLSKLKSDTRYCELSFLSFFDLDILEFCDPITEKAIGENIDYGSLFVYLFRRFGYPNSGWDDYKQLAKYVLSTPKDDMFLQVVPYLGNTSTITFTFLVPIDVVIELETHCHQKYDIWHSEMLEWYEENCELPTWMPEFMAANSEWNEGEITNWRDTIRFVPFIPEGENRDQVTEWLESMKESYSEIKQMPDYFENKDSDWINWTEDDPLKPYADAAFKALIDLKKPVGVRDSQMNAFGPVANSRSRVLRPASVSGYPSGALGNEAPSEFSELHALVSKLGNGNAKQGIKRLKSLVNVSGQ